jgi:hypothetical protein
MSGLMLILEIALGVFIGMISAHFLIANGDTVMPLLKRASVGVLYLLALLFVFVVQFYFWNRFGWYEQVHGYWIRAKGLEDYFALAFTVMFLIGICFGLGKYSVWLLGYPPEEWEKKRFLFLIALGSAQMVVFALVAEVKDGGLLAFWLSVHGGAICWRSYKGINSAN